MALAGIRRLAAGRRPVTDAMLGAEAGESWLHTNGNYGGHRFSTLTAINAGNAKDLKLAWAMSPGGKTDAQATPSYHDGLLYFPQDNKCSRSIAGTGRIVWKYDPQAAGRLGRLQRVVLHRQAPRRGALRRTTSTSCPTTPSCTPSTMKTGKAKWVKAYDGFPYPKDFAKAKDSNGYCTTVGPMAIAGAIIVPMNATDTGGLAGYVLGVNPETGDNAVEGADDPREGRNGRTTAGRKAARLTAEPARGSPAPTIPT